MKKTKIVLTALTLALALLLAMSLFACGGCGPAKEEDGPELGTYYCDVDGYEHTLTLFQGKQFLLSMKNASLIGSYTLEGETLTLKEGDTTAVTATLKDNIVTLEYNGTSLRLLRKTAYTVSFEANGGSAVPAETVLNGNTAKKPADPTREGYVFLGWYADAACKTPFNFDSTVITADTAVYAAWAKTELGQSEYTISYVTGVDGLTYEKTATIGGKLYGAPTPTREGYTFAGWFVSMANEGDKLSYRYTEDMVFAENTTLFAVWQPASASGKLNAPSVSVTEKGVEWEAILGASYRLIVTGPEGFSGIDKTVGTTSENIDFAGAPAGDYIIRVTAVAASSENNSEETVRYYKNKALPRVSFGTFIDPSVLVFVPVKGAEKYLISIECGNPAHNHTALDNGNSTYYNFANCQMKEGGIRIRVIAVADGYASSVSDAFVCDRTLAAAGGFRVEEEDAVLRWAAVPGATRYLVVVKQGDKTYAVTNNGETYVSLKPYTGALTVSVTPVTEGFNSPAAAEYTYAKGSLPTPGNLRLVGKTLTFDAVEGAASYEVKIGGKIYPVTDPTFDLSAVSGFAIGADYTVSVRAVGAVSSLYSDEVSIRYSAMYPTLRYENGRVYWHSVINAVTYEIRVNGGKSFTVTDGASSAPVTFDRAGTNTVEVRYVDDTGFASAWVSLDVTAYAIEFDARGGETVSAIYLAKGDRFTLPTATKTGFEFAGWYNAPAGNAGLYTATVYEASGDTLLYAAWTGKTYRVTLEHDDGSGKTDTADLVFGTHFTLPVLKSDDATKVFAGWYSAANGGGVQYTGDDGVSLLPWDIAGEDTKLYANWLDVLSYAKLQDGTYSVSMGAGIGYVTSVTIPEKYQGVRVTVVEGYAFQRCSKLLSVNIPDTIRIIETDTAFSGCSKLQSVNIYHVEGNNDIVYSSDNGILMYRDEATGQLELKFVPQKVTGDFVVPDGITAIPLKLFSGSTISSVTIPASVVKIEQNAFYNCKKLETVTFLPVKEGEDTKALEIAAKAFSSCSALTEITLPARLSTFTTDIFTSCSKLARIHMEEGSTNYASIDGVICDKDKTTILYCPLGRDGAYTVPAGIVAIGEKAFYQCTKLQSVTIPGFVSSIGTRAFYGCTMMDSLTFGDGAFADQTVGEYAFGNCSRLRTLSFVKGSRVIEIGKNAFNGCSLLGELVVPATLKTIGEKAFSGCKSMKSVTFEEGSENQTFGDYVFEDCVGLTSVYLPASVTELHLNVFDGCDNLVGVYVDAANQNYCDIDGVLFTKDQTELLFYSKTRPGDYTIPATVKKIGTGVFNGNKKMVRITISKNIIEIEDEAFKGCIALQEVSFEEGGTEPLTFGTSVFEECAALHSFTFPTRATEVGKKMFYFANTGKSTLTKVELHDRITSIGDSAFYRCDSLEPFAIPASVTEIQRYAFYYCIRLENVVVPVGVKVIGDGAFNNCQSLKTISLPEGLEELGATALNSTSLTTVVIPKSVKKFGTSLFGGNKKLTSVTVAGGGLLPMISQSMFSGCTALKEITISKDLTEIGFNAFYNCTALEKVTFEKGGTEPLLIGSTTSATGSVTRGYAFQRCTALKEIEIPARATSLERYAFQNCTSLEKITFEAGSQLAFIGEYSFYGCAKLKSITIPAGVVNRTYDPKQSAMKIVGLGERAFYNCTALESVIFEEPAAGAAVTGKLSVGDYAFYGCSSLKSLTFPKRLGSYMDKGTTKKLALAGVNTFVGCASLTEIVIPDTVEDYKTLNGVLYTKDMKTLVLCPAGKAGFVSIPGTVTLIKDKAFYKCVNLKGINFLDGTEPLVIGDSAVTKSGEVFRYCSSLTRMQFPERTKSINGYALAYCTALKEVTLPSTLETIGSYLFQHAEALNKVEFPAEGKLTKISTYTFSYCKALETIRIPGYITAIDNYAFEYCGSLKNVTFEDSENKLTFGNYSFRYCGMETFTIPRRASTFGNDTFDYCKALKTVNAEPGCQLSKIGNYTFFHCEALESFVFPSNLATIGNSVFSYCTGLKSVTFSKSYASKFNSGIFNGCKALEEIKVEAGSKMYSVVDNVLFSADKKTIYYYPAYLNAASYQIPSGVTSVADQAFQYAENRRTVTIPSTGTSLGNSVFRYCENLRTAVIPKSVKTIGTSLFSDCPALESVTFESGSKLKKLSDRMIYNDVSIRSFTVPDGVTDIGTYAFSRSGVKTVNFPVSVTSIGGNAFAYCTDLTDVNFASGSKLTTIGTTVFQNCSALTQITLPSGVTSIGNYAFQRTGLTEVTIPDGVTAIGNYAFMEAASLKKVTLPDSVTTIGNNAFQNCVALTEVRMPAGLTEIKTRAFDGCISLRAAVLPAGVTTIGTYAFQNCASLESFTIPASVTALANYTFNGCAALKAITIPGTVQTIGAYAFGDCTSLADLEIRNGVAAIANGAFGGCSALQKIELPGSVITMEGNPFIGCASLTEFIVASDNADFVVKDRILYSSNLATLIASPSDLAGEFIVPEHVISIAPGAFSNTDLTRVTLPEGITTLPDYLFDGCDKLVEANYGSLVTTIGNYAFRGTGLRSVYIDKRITKIGDGAFENCPSLTELTFNQTGSDRLTIGIGAFRTDPIEELVLPLRVYTTGITGRVLHGIDNDCFADNPVLRTVRFGTEGNVQYAYLTLGTGAFRNCTALESVEFPYTLKNVTVYISGGGGSSGTTVYPFGAYCFADCTALREVKLNVPEGATSSQFNLYGYVYFTAEGEVSSVGGSAFAFMNCTSLKTFEIPSCVTNIAPGLFMNSGITSVEIGAEGGTATITLGVYAFAGCKDLTSFVSYQKITSIPENAFNGCISLTDAIFEDGTTRISANAFRNCRKLRNLSLSMEAVTKIEAGAFAGCTALPGLDVYDKVTTLGAGAFDGWGAGQTIRFVGLASPSESWDEKWDEGCSATLKWNA